jgi:CheY-like chemotaxis protein
MTPTSETKNNQNTPPAKRQTVLVVDDEQDLRSLVANVLTEYGYKVVTASSGAKAVALIEKMEAPPDLMLTQSIDRAP